MNWGKIQVEDKEATSSLDAAVLSMQRIEVEDSLDALTARERRVLQLRFGLFDTHERTVGRTRSISWVPRTEQ